MNSEQLIIEAGEAIKDFTKRNDITCELYIENGLVCARRIKFSIPSLKNNLIITRWQQKYGLTSAQWNTIGNELFNLHNKELACQEHQKP